MKDGQAMIIVSASQFYIYSNVGPFNQEKALVGAFSMIVKTDGSFAALVFSATCFVS